MGVTLFLDKNMGRKRLKEMLESVGLSVEVHHDHFCPTAPDDEWIKICADKGWIIVTGDKGIESTPINRQAVCDSNAKVFITTDTNTRSEVWGAAIILGKDRILEFIKTKSGPFFSTIRKTSGQHITRPRKP